jgi:hypothetical protein
MHSIPQRTVLGSGTVEVPNHDETSRIKRIEKIVLKWSEIV